MKILLDTHALLWSMFSPQSLNQQGRAAIEDGSNLVFVSMASLWELGIKLSIGKLDYPSNIFEKFSFYGFEILPIKLEHIEALTQLAQLRGSDRDKTAV